MKSIVVSPVCVPPWKPCVGFRNLLGFNEATVKDILAFIVIRSGRTLFAHITDRSLRLSLVELDLTPKPRKRKTAEDPDFTLLRTVWREDYFIVQPPLHELRADNLLRNTYLQLLPLEILLLIAQYEVDPAY